MNVRFAAAVVFAVLAACGGSKQSAPAGGIELTTYDAEVRQQSVDRLVLAFPWEVHNPSGDKASVGALTWRVDLDDSSAAQGRQTPGGEAAPGGKTSGILEVTVALPTTPEALAARQEATALRWHCAATLEIAAGDQVESYEAEWNGEIFPPRAPRVTLDGQAGRYGDKGFELNFKVGVSNPNPFAVAFESLDYVLEINGTELAKDTLSRAMELAPSSEFQFDIQKFVGQKEHVELAKELQKLPAIPYRLSGTLRVSGLSLPTLLEGSITLPSR